MISFVIPTLNEEKYLGQTLSYLSQYLGDHEIIISDTNSTDQTREIAKKYTSNIIVHSQNGKRQTIAHGRNIGAAMARGDYLVFLDAEICILEPNEFFLKAMDCFNSNDMLVGLTGQLHVFPDQITLGDKIWIPFFIFIRFIMNNYLGRGAATGEFMMLKTEAFKQISGFEESLVAGEDDDLFHRLSKIGKTRLDMGLVAYHSNRRAHALGWPKLLWVWTKESLSIWIYGHTVSKEWKEIR